MKKTIIKGVIENMSKMRMPEMSVVRFTESDVIVASSVLKTAALYQFDNGGTNDAYIEAGGTTYYHTGSTNFDALEAAYSNVNDDTKFYWDVGAEQYGQATFSQLLGYDAGTSAQGNATDGNYDYRYGNSGWGFYHQ